MLSTTQRSEADVSPRSAHHPICDACETVSWCSRNGCIPVQKAANVAAWYAPRFAVVSCSQCGEDFGPRDAGYSHCSDHEADAVMAAERADCPLCSGTGEGQRDGSACAGCRGRGYVGVSS